jgi:RNA polymerase sigma-70 factor (ECF subfamily)
VVARGQEHEAREALQETLLRVVRHVRRFDSEEAFWSWLKVVARSAARDAGRKQHRYLQLLQKFTFHSQTSAIPESSQSDDLFGSSLEQSLATLVPMDRRLVEGKYLEGATVRDLASESGLTEKAVESRLLRLRRRLREQILKHLGSE